MEKLTGKFLVASPNMTDPSFERTVVFVAGHETRQGALGMVINRPGTIPVQEVCRQLGVDAGRTRFSLQDYIGWGGPVQPTHGYILHSVENGKHWDVTIFDGGNIAVTASPDIVMACARGEGPQRMHLVLGCAAWAPGQLEEELRQNAWLVAEADERVLFTLPEEQRYEAALALVGMDPGSVPEKASAFGSFPHMGHA